MLGGAGGLPYALGAAFWLFGDGDKPRRGVTFAGRGPGGSGYLILGLSGRPGGGGPGGRTPSRES